MNKTELREKMQEILSKLDWKGLVDEPDADGQLVELPAGSTTDKGWVKVRDMHRKLLESVAKHPLFSISEHVEEIGNASPWMVNKAAEELINLGFLESPLAFSLGLRGNPRKYWRITPRGAEFLGIDFEDCKVPGKSKFEHSLYQHIISSCLKNQGRSALIENMLNGKSIDVTEYRPDGVVWAYEVELRPSIPHIKNNIADDLAAGCERVILVARNRNEQKRLMTFVYGNIPAGLLEKISFKTIGDFSKQANMEREQNG